MASYYLRIQIIGRSRIISALGTAAYRSASKLHDFRQNLDFDHSNKPNVIHSEVLAPDGAPRRLLNRQVLWNAVEASEKRSDAQLARDVEFALPHELPRSEAIALAKEFVQSEFVVQGMIADLNVHWDRGNPHAHVMLTTRELSPDGFGLKARQWNKVELLRQWREHWADLTNQHLVHAGVDARIDHRSYRDQGIELEPTGHLSFPVLGKAARGERPQRWLEFEEVRQRNARLIELHPEIIFDGLTRKQSTFTLEDAARVVARYLDCGDRFERLMARLEQSPELVSLTDPISHGNGVVESARYTTRTMLRLEQQIADVACEMATTRRHPVTKAALDRICEPLRLASAQQGALTKITNPCAIAVLAESPGAGASAVLATAKAAWEASGYRVHGASPSSLTAKKLMETSGIEAKTLASWELAWKSPERFISRRDVFIINEAGMVGSRQLGLVLARLREAGAKAVLIGDIKQFRPIEAGAALRTVAERTGYYELTSVRSEQSSWQREALLDLASGHLSEALDRYRRHGAVHFAQTRKRAIDELLEDWTDYHIIHGAKKSSIILAPEGAEAHELNRRVRKVLSERDELVNEVALKVWHEVNPARGFALVERSFAVGERVMFLKKDSELDLKRGMLGTVIKISKDSISVTLDGSGQEVTFDPHSYAAIEYGYAASVVRARSATVDRVFLLATPAMDSDLAKLGLSCHRELGTLYAGQDDFADIAALMKRLSRAQLKDPRFEYAARRGLEYSLGNHPTSEHVSQASMSTDLQNEPGHGSVQGPRIAQQEFMKGWGAEETWVKVGAAELHRQVGQAAREITSDRASLSEAGRALPAREVSGLLRRIERNPARNCDRDFDMEL